MRQTMEAGTPPLSTENNRVQETDEYQSNVIQTDITKELLEEDNTEIIETKTGLMEITAGLAVIYNVAMAFALVLPHMLTQAKKSMTPEELEIAVIIHILTAVFHTVRAVLAVFLLIGVYLERLSFYWPWMIYSILGIVSSLAICVALFIWSDFNLLIILALIAPCIDAYFTLVIYSDYRDQKQYGN